MNGRPSAGSAETRLDAAVRLLSGDVAALTHRVDELKLTAESALGGAAAAQRGVTGLAETVAGLAAGAGDEDGPEESDPVPSWLLIEDPDQAADVLADLIEWIGAVYGRWSDAKLRECWTWHPAVVAELQALQAAWQAAYGGKRPNPSAVMDWLDRHRPGVVRRVDVELQGCSLAKHSPGGDAEWRPPRVLGTDMAGEIAGWWANSHGSTAGPPPSAGMLAAARARISDRR